MLKKYHIGSLLKLPILYYDFLLNFDGDVFFFLGELLINYISYYAFCSMQLQHHVIYMFRKKKKLCELFIPDLLRDVFLLDCGIIFLSPKIFCVYVSC